MRTVRVVTGGTSGMGLATAKALGADGPVLIGGRSEARMARALDELKAAGVEAYGSQLDVSDAASVAAFAAKAADIAPIGTVVHAAAVDMDNADTDAIVRINVLGTVNVVNAFLPRMNEGGVLVNFSSVTGYYYRPTANELAVWDDPDNVALAERFAAGLSPLDAPGLSPYAAAYFASKAFVMRYTKANAQRFARKGCRIFSVSPGSFMTPMLETQEENYDSIKKTTVFERFGDPDEMAYLIASLVDSKAEYLTGVDVLVDGGMFAKRCVPQLP